MVYVEIIIVDRLMDRKILNAQGKHGYMIFNKITGIFIACVGRWLNEQEMN